MRIGLFGGERIAEESTIVVPFSRLAQPLVRLSSSKRGIH